MVRNICGAERKLNKMQLVTGDPNQGNIDRIEAGDTVWVSFGAGIIRLVGVVLYIPQATGDCWILRDVPDGNLVYVQQFERMVLYKKGETSERNNDSDR